MTTLQLYKKSRELQEAGKRYALATVIGTTGSTPQKAGASALFEAAGSVWGTLGGGCMEAESRRRALLSLDTSDAQLFDLKLDEVTGWDDGLICGGKVRILVQPNPESMHTVFSKASEAWEKREHGAVVTVLKHPNLPLGDMYWLTGKETDAPVLLEDVPHLYEAISKAQVPFVYTQTLNGETIEFYVEPVVPPPALIIAGAGHIGKALARQGALLGFEVTVIDDREAFANAENIPWANRIVCGDIAESITAIQTDSQSYIVIVTRGHRHDGAVLAACIHKPAAFIGMIGSKRKSLLIRKELEEEGIATAEELAKVISPVGLDIGGESVEEIALSIAAQLVAVRRKGALEASAMNYTSCGISVQ